MARQRVSATLTNQRQRDHLNDRQRASRPPAKTLVDRPAILVRRGLFGSQVSQANYVLYDGRLHGSAALFTAAEIDGFRRGRRTFHSLVELAKGLVLRRPELLTAARETFFVAMVWQLMAVSGQLAKTMPLNWHDALKIVEAHSPVAAILRAIALVVRRDYDIEHRFNAAFWDRHLPGRPAPLTHAQRRQYVADFVRRKCQATLRSAMTQVTTANYMAQHFGIRRAPRVVVQARGGHLGPRPRILTQAEILGI